MTIAWEELRLGDWRDLNPVKSQSDVLCGRALCVATNYPCQVFGHGHQSSEYRRNTLIDNARINDGSPRATNETGRDDTTKHAFRQ